MKTRNIVLITAGCCVLAGAIISGAAAMKLQDAHKYEDKEVVKEITEKINKIDVTSEYGGIKILPSENDKIIVEYIDNGVKPYRVDVNNGILIIKPTDGVGKVGNWLDHILNVDIHKRENYILSIKVPKDMVTDIEAENDAGEIEIADGRFKNIYCSVDYGGLKIHNVTADSINIESDCGDVELNEVTADVKAECDMGEIRFEGLKGKNITLDNDCGDIKGTILGKEEDYSIKAEIAAGNKNIENRTGGQNRLDVNVDMGDINIKFVE